MYDLRARYYAPAIGRFNSRDTFGYNFRSPNELIRYSYAANNPINAIDPLGLQALVEYEAEQNPEKQVAVENAGEEFASEAEMLVDDELWDALPGSAGDLGEGAAKAIRAENLASELVEEGLNSPNAQSLINKLAQLATNNSDAEAESLVNHIFIQLTM